MKRNRRLTALAFGIALAALAAGCGTTAPQVRRPSVTSDACAERLHDVCGRLLLHYARHRRIPATLADLAAVDPLDPMPLTCPVSEKPYVYHGAGLPVPGRPGRLVLYDATPCHAGMRWCIFIDDTQDPGRLVTRVILLPDDLIPPATTP